MSRYTPLPALGSLSTAIPARKIGNASTVLEFGDSIVAGLNDAIPAVDPTFRALLPLETALTAAFTGAGKTPPTYTNTAVAGQTSTDMVAALVAQTPVNKVYLTIFPVNDVFFTVPTATTKANVRTILRRLLQHTPDALIVWGLPSYLQGEKWPLGQNTNDSAIQAMNNAVRTVFAETEFAGHVVIVDLQADSFALAPTVNPTNLATGVQTQSLGTHPAKAGTRPAGVDAQTTWSADFQALIPVDLS